MEAIKETELCKIAYKYKTDKCPKVKHLYTPIYHELFKDKRDSIKKVVEVGIGSLVTMAHVKKRTGYDYIVGASLMMWRDYFPNAQVYGADWDKDTTVTGEERIKTILVDETKEEDLARLSKEVGEDVDIFVDDGEHSHHVQIGLAKYMLPRLKKDVVYIIEDVFSVNRIKRGLPGYEFIVPKIDSNAMRENIVIVKNK